MRGYAQFDAERLAELGEDPTCSACSARAFSPSPSIGRRPASVIRASCRWEGAGLGAAAENYFAQSEQIPEPRATSRCATVPDGALPSAPSLLLQHLLEGEIGRERRLHVRHDHPDWEHVLIMAPHSRPSGADRFRASPLSDIAWRPLFHEDAARSASFEPQRDQQGLPLRDRSYPLRTLPLLVKANAQGHGR